MGDIRATGYNVLVELLDDEQKSGEGLILPATKDNDRRLSSGKVLSVGPGFLVPFLRIVPNMKILSTFAF